MTFSIVLFDYNALSCKQQKIGHQTMSGLNWPMSN